MIIYLILLGGSILKHRIPILITFVLAVVMLLSATSLTALAVHEDHSNPNSTAERVTLDSAEILELALGIELTEAERDYLVAYGGESITYGTKIPTAYVVTAYDEESGTLDVYARAYEYTTASGLKKTWTPKVATLGERSVPLSLGTGNKYVGEIKNVTENEAATLDVLYAMSLTVSAKTLNSLMNKAATDAPKWDAYDGYLKAREEYYTAFAAYEAYLVDKSIYDAKLAEYEVYLGELAEYEADLLEYAEYEAALAVYNSDYAKYLDYLDRLDKYDADLALYNQYLADLETVDYHLSIIYGTTLKHTSLRRSVRNSIMGDMVSQVLENRDAIANELTNIDPAVIDNAGVCTDNLRVFYTEYELLQTTREQYTYYAMNYEKIRDNFIGLFQSLDLLYSNGKIRLALSNQGIKEKYEILLAQLYCIVNTISDDPVSNYYGTAYYGSTYTISGRTPLAVLEGTLYMEHLHNAAPLEGGYPSEVTMPEQVVDTVDEPTKPTAVLHPVAPDVVDDPGEAPDVVLKPTVPTAVEPPMTLSDPYTIPDAALSLLTAYRAGEISARTVVTEGVKITIEATASKKIFGTDEIAINFYDAEGALLDTVNVERGSYVEFVGTLPTKAEDEVATYSFVGWQDADGNPVDMQAIECDGATLDLYPTFDILYKTYDVTWIVDGKKTVTKERFGVIPTAPFTPSKGDTGSFFYEFKGWNRELAAVSADPSQNTYTAIFESKFIVPFSNGSGAMITVDGADYILDCTASPDSTFDLSNIVPRAAGKGGITIRTNGYTLKFSYNEVLAMSTQNVVSATVYSAARGVYGYSFYVDLFNSSAEEVSGIKTSIVLPYTLADPSHARLYYFADDMRTYVKATVTDTSLSATVNSGPVYYVSLFYAVDVIGIDEVKVSVSDNLLTAGSKGTISAEAPEGVEIISYYLVKGSGQRVELDGPEFVMPADSVSVGVVCSYVQYTVKFVSDGTVISVKTYKHGELPEPPPDPKKSTDALYSYEFAGWDAEISAVTADATYNAVYTSTPVPVAPKPVGPQISDKVMDLIVKVLVIAAYGLVVVLPLYVVAVTKFIRRLRWLKPRKKARKK